MLTYLPAADTHGKRNLRGEMALEPYDDRPGMIWLDGQMVPWANAKIHVLSHGLHYASTVFEGERAYGGEVFKLTEHSQRLHDSAGMLGYAIPWSVAEIDAATRAVVATQGLTDGYVRPIAWRGPEQLGVSAQATKIHLAIAAWDWGSYFDPEARRRGLRLAMAHYRRPDPATAPSKSKASGLYMICTLEKHRAEAAGYADALMLDWRGRVAEATGANVFFWDGAKLHTPTPDCFLDGITRRTVIGLAQARGLEVVERAIAPEELAGFTGCFLTGTAAEVTPVSEIGEWRFDVGGPIPALMDDYATLTRAEDIPALKQAV